MMALEHGDPVAESGVVMELSDESSSSGNASPAQTIKQLWAAEGIDVVAPTGAEMVATAAAMAATGVDKDDEKVCHEGYLRKRYSSSYYMGTERYCVVVGNRMRWYMTQELAHKDVQLRGEVWVKAVEPWNGHGSMNTYPNAFAIRTSNNRVLLCSARSPEEKEAWVQSLTRCVTSERQRRLSRRLVRNLHEGGGITLAHAHGPESAERRRIVPEDAVRAMSENVDVKSPRQHHSASILSTASDSEASLSAYFSTECSRCAVRFGTFLARRVVCYSCHAAYCSRHCNKYVKLHHTNSKSTRKCCLRCARRQEFLLYLSQVQRFMNTAAQNLKEVKTLASMIQRPAASTPAAQAQEDEIYERTMTKLRTAPMSLNKTIKILYQTRQKPHLFCIACERLPYYVENCVDRVESLWYQILHLFQCCDTEFDAFSIQLFCLKRYIGAICRRSPRIALQTIWHVQASMEDATRHHPNSLLLLLGLLYPPSTGSQAWSELLLPDCPEHQRTAIVEKLSVVHNLGQKLTANEPDSMIERWLNAKTVAEFEACARELEATGKRIIDYQSCIHYGSLRMEGVEDECSCLEEVVADQVRFVQSLAAISERLRHVQPVENRSKHLVKELEELNEHLIASALYPLCTASDELYKVVRIPPTEGKVFSTKMRAPTLIFVEAVPVDASNLVGSERLLPFTSGSHRGNLTFVESVSPLIDETTQPRDSLSSSTESSNGTASGATPHHRRHGSQLSCTSDFDAMMSTTDDDLSTPTGSTNGQSHLQSNSLSAPASRHMSYQRDGGHTNGRSDSTQSMPAGIAVGGFSLSGFSGPPTPRNNHARMENIVYESKIYGESWEERRERIRRESPHGHLPGWELFSIIVKTNDDLRQEMFTMQMLNKLKSIFEFEQLNLWLRTYRIVATGANIGLLETINDACSLDHLKKSFTGGNNLYTYFRSTYGDPNTPSFEIARRNFIQSMAAYSIVSYVLLVKDRHNGNILLSAQGHIIHIDFGFILGIAPGGMFSIEDAPFKLTEEMVEIMGGTESTGYALYRKLMVDGFLALQKYQSEIAALLQTTGQHSPFPCFEGAKLARVVSELRGRLCVGLTKRQIEKRVDHLIKKSFNAWGTRQYDSFQLRSNNIQP